MKRSMGITRLNLRGGQVKRGPTGGEWGAPGTEASMWPWVENLAHFMHKTTLSLIAGISNWSRGLRPPVPLTLTMASCWDAKTPHDRAYASDVSIAPSIEGKK